ncbi:MAG TPA: SEC-C metal-binding domain-containing protein, partial [Thermoanaerobaculia bacterium]|nr:SEC-C metal-binding domain-containing protein [Thermoanaerobaculia bacterium]
MTPGRNDPCLCGSGLKYKKCHLRSDENEVRVPEPHRAPVHDAGTRLV